MKKVIALGLAALFSLTMIGTAFADADDTTWINQCVADNSKEGAAADVVKKYCTCMNNKMSSSEMQSITNWENSHPEARKDCEKQSGWK